MLQCRFCEIVLFGDRAHHATGIHGSLDHARSAAHDACSGANRGSSATANGRGDLAKVFVALTGNGVRKIGVVKEIEEVRPELQMDFFGAQREVLGNGKIVVGQAWAVIPWRKTRSESP